MTMTNHIPSKDSLQAAFSLLLKQDPQKACNLGLIDQTTVENLYTKNELENDKFILSITENIIKKLDFNASGKKNSNLKNKIQNLAANYCDNPKKIKEINAAIFHYAKYTQSVIMMEQKFGERGTFAYLAESNDEYMQELEAADSHRKNCHNVIISYTLMLNNAAKEKGLPLIYDGMIADRASIGDLAFAIQKDFFENRRWTPYAPTLDCAHTINNSVSTDIIQEIASDSNIKRTELER